MKTPAKNVTATTRAPAVRRRARKRVWDRRHRLYVGQIVDLAERRRSVVGWSVARITGFHSAWAAPGFTGAEFAALETCSEGGAVPGFGLNAEPVDHLLIRPSVAA